MKSYFIVFRLMVLISFLNFFSENTTAQWQQMSAGITGGYNVSCLAVSGSKVFAGTMGEGIYVTTNDGVSWNTVNNGLTSLAIYSIAVSGTNIFAGTYSGGVFRTSNNGANWESANTGIEGMIYSFAISGTNIYACGNAGVFLSVNNGNNWTELVNGLPNLFSSTAVAISGPAIFAAENTTGFGGVYRSSDGGSNWTVANSGLGTGSVHSLGVSGTNIFAGTSSGIYVSGNQGNNWSAVNSGLPGLLYINTFGVYGTNVFAGTNPPGGIYLTTNNGANWLDKNLGLSGPMYVYSIAVSNNYIFAAKYHSVWRRAYLEIIGVNTLSTEVPEKYLLEQNYPNPFNPVTKIRFSIPENAKHDTRYVRITVYNSLGKMVENILNEKLPPGSYEVEFDGSNYSSGTYIYKLESDFFAQARKMILIR